MATGLIGDEAYAAGFVWGAAQPFDGTPQAAVAAIAAALEAEHTTIDWRATVASIRASRVTG
jgi:hypothetical protein